MAENKRRTILKALLAYPPMLSLRKMSFAQMLFGASQAQETDAYEHRYLAVRICRLLNTAQLWHKNETGHYASISTLRESAAMEKLLNDPRTDAMGIGKTLYEKLNLDVEEIVPGWKFKFLVSDDSMGYVLRLESTVEAVTSNFSTDQIGIIYEGSLLAADVMSPQATALDVIDGAEPLRSSGRAGKLILRFARTLSFGVPASGCCFCSQFPCCCGLCCGCQSGFIAGQCHNCGCRSCVFCCCAF